MRDALPRAGLRLVASGPETSALAASGAQAATFKFFVSYLKRARGSEPAEPKVLASLEGQLERQGATVKFTAAAPALLVHEPVSTPAATDSSDPRAQNPIELELNFPADQFSGLGARRLRIPRAPNDEARFLELRVELSIDGTVEIPLTLSDTWDVPYAPLRRKVLWSVFNADVPEDSELVVSRADGSLVLSASAGRSADALKFDLTGLSPDDEYALDLRTRGASFAPPLQLNIQAFEAGLLRDDAKAAAKSFVFLEQPLPAALTGSEEHSFEKFDFQEAPPARLNNP